tara:strand:- start:1072 stop:2436 length:1365 start_codon:yes stop_codon:yes gene_type:complete
MANYIVKEHNGSDGTDSRTKSTFAVWVKRTRLGVDEQIWSWGEDNSADARLKFKSDDILRLHSDGTGSPIETTRKFRDLHGWYHFVVAFDGSSGTEAHRRRIWINGVEWVHGASTSTFSAAVAGHNSVQDLYIGDNARLQQNSSNAEPFQGYMSHFHYCDGYAYTASDFGEFDSSTGEWKPITEPSVNYGTHGIFLKMEDSSNMDLDSSPNASSQLSTTGTILSSQDCPSNVFATWNTLATDNGNYDTTNGGLSFSNGDNNWSHGGLISTIGIPTSGKYYWEHKKTYAGSHIIFGLIREAQAYRCYRDSSDDIYEKINGVQCSNSSNSGLYLQESSDTGQIGAVANGDILQCAYDADNRKLWYGINGTWQNSGDPANGTNETIGSAEFTAGEVYFPFAQSHNATGTASSDTNFGNGYFGTSAIASEGTNASGNGKFEYDVPTGFTALSTKGLNE